MCPTGENQFSKSGYGCACISSKALIFKKKEKIRKTKEKKMSLWDQLPDVLMEQIYDCNCPSDKVQERIQTTFSELEKFRKCVLDSVWRQAVSLRVNLDLSSEDGLIKIVDLFNTIPLIYDEKDINRRRKWVLNNQPGYQLYPEDFDDDFGSTPRRRREWDIYNEDEDLPCPEVITFIRHFDEIDLSSEEKVLIGKYVADVKTLCWKLFANNEQVQALHIEEEGCDDLDGILIHILKKQIKDE